jgi:Carboxypeptidase regulatory-like domain
MMQSIRFLNPYSFMWRKCYFKLFLGMVVTLALHPNVGSSAGGPTPPQLGIALSAPRQITLFWQDTNNWPQSSDTLADSFYWVNVSAAPVISGASNTITLPADQSATFFRLVNSPFIPPPTELTIGNNRDTNENYFFELAWDSVPGAAAYNLYLATVPGVNKSNYMNLPGGMVITAITNLYANVPEVPKLVYTPVLITGASYYFVVTAVSASGAESAESNPASGIYGPSASVSGSVFTTLLLGTNSSQVALPGVSLSLSNTANPAFSASVRSDLNGDFAFPNLPAGNYQLCWQAKGFVPGCSNPMTISNVDIDVDAIQLFPNTNTGFVYGQLSYQDGSALFSSQNKFFQIAIAPVVTLTNSVGHLLSTALVNSSGQYVMAGVPVAANLFLALSVENAGILTNINTSITGEADLVLPDARPIIQSIVATTNGQEVYSVPAGTTVQVAIQVSYSGAGSLAYEWFNPDGTVAPYPSATNISWNLPATADGFQYLFVRVSDGRGGYDTARVELTTDNSVFFSGTVLNGITAVPLTNAVVQLNGLVTSTDTNGTFTFTVTITNEYDLSISCAGYAPMANVFLDGASDEIYTLLPITPPSSVNCESSAPLLMVTNFANGVSVAIPTPGLLDINNNSYSGCVRVTLDTLDPCSDTNYFGNGAMMTNGNTFQPYALANLGVWDINGKPLHLDAGFFAEVFLPIAQACVDTNFSIPSTAGFFNLLKPPTNRWSPTGSGNLATNTYGINTFVGYDGLVGALALLEAGPQPAPLPATVNLKFNVDASLHVPLRIGLFLDNGKGAPDLKQPIAVEGPNATKEGYVDIEYDGYVLKKVAVPANKIIWIEVLSLRQAPGAYYGTGNALVADSAKEIIQALKLTVANGADAIPVTLGLGVNVDVPRSVQLAQLTDKTVKAISTEFLIAREPGQEHGIEADKYYGKIDPGNRATTFTDWQKKNGWNQQKMGIGMGDDTAYALYFNANDLGAGRRMGMKIFSDADKKDSVAYYVATYDTLKDAEETEKDHLQFGGKLKYIVCMEFSLTLDKKDNKTPLTGDRYIKFYAFGPDGKITDKVPNEARGQSLSVPQVCMECHGAGTDTGGRMGDKKVNATHGEVLGEFIPFDTANYTFLQNGTLSHDSLVKDKTFTKLNNGLLTSQNLDPKKPYMPGNLSLLINALVKNDKNYTTAPTDAAPNWGNNAGDVNLYNTVYAVSCRSCHVTQPGGAVSGTVNFGSAAGYTKKVMKENYSAQAVKVKPVMPHAQRTFGIFYGSATANKLDAIGIPANPIASQLKLLFGEDPKFQ